MQELSVTTLLLPTVRHRPLPCLIVVGVISQSWADVLLQFHRSTLVPELVLLWWLSRQKWLKPELIIEVAEDAWLVPKLKTVVSPSVSAKANRTSRFRDWCFGVASGYNRTDLNDCCIELIMGCFCFCTSVMLIIEQPGSWYQSKLRKSRPLLGSGMSTLLIG